VLDGGGAHDGRPATTVAPVGRARQPGAGTVSSAAPHLFGARLAAFERDLRRLLRRISPSGRFSERTRDIALDIWRRI
jgi:hypothetical protein